MKKAKGFPCICAAGLGERDTENMPCKLRDGHADRTAVRAIYDNRGRWLVLWREADGEEWVGRYRLIPL